MEEPTMAQLFAVIKQQQDQMSQQSALVTQLIANAAAPPAALPVAVQPIPRLPDITSFDHDDQDKNKIEEWLQRFTFAIECAAPTANSEIKVKVLMNKLSEASFSEYAKSCLPDEVTKFDFDETVTKLKKLFARPQSVFLDRYECLKASRNDGEDFLQFVNRHKKLLRDFKFTELNEEPFKCLMLLTALKSPKDAKLRQHILTKLTADADAIKYDAVVEHLINYMSTISEAKMLESNGSKSVNAIRHKKFESKTKVNFQKSYSAPSTKCWRCGLNHKPTECRHKMAICRKCNKAGHLDVQCESVQEWKRKNPYNGPYKNPHNSNKFYGDNKDKKRVGLVQVGSTINSSSALRRVMISVNGNPIEFVLDCGAEINILEQTFVESIGNPEIHKNSETAKFFDGSKCSSFLGKGKATFEFNGKSTEQEFSVAKKGSLNLLSVQTMEELGFMDQINQMIKDSLSPKCDDESELIIANTTNPPPFVTKSTQEFIENLKSEFAEVFKEGLGLCTIKAHLTLKPDAKPKYCKARPVPYNVREAIDKELDRLIEMEVLTPVEHTEWAAPILAVKKPEGKIRVCSDFSTGLNKALLMNQHPLPIPQDIFACLNGGKYFSKIDLRDAYLQVMLDEESKLLCVIATHRGNMRHNRMPFGVNSAPGIFQEIMDNMLAGLNFSKAYLDDLVVASKSIEEHMIHLTEVFKRILKFGLRVKLEKCAFFEVSIKYLGVIVDREGLRPDPNKISAIIDMPAPIDVPQLRSFLGMVNHYQHFVKNMRFIRQPLDELTKKGLTWEWTKECDEAVEKIKNELKSDKLLTHYDPNLEIIVAADASDYGIGFVISHRFPDGSIKAVAHASRSLSPAEKNYSQIEKEGLALVTAVQKFHKFIYGRHFTLQTDHKPLLTIFGNKKGIRQCSANRLMRWSLILLAYDFDIEYISTTEFGQADALSRLIAKQQEPDTEFVVASVNTSVDVDLENLIRKLPITFKDLVLATKNDSMLVKVGKYVTKCWPNIKHIKEESEEVKLFYRRKDDLSIVKGCLMYADRVVIPRIMQARILNLIHEGHPGIKRMKQLARNYVYWPKMDSKIEEFVKNCEPCRLTAKSPIKTELHSWPKATKPWERIHIDFAGPFFNKVYLIVVDAFSKYPEVFEMKRTTSSTTIEKLRYLFSRHGLPETLVSDNGTQFSSSEFKRFVEANGINHMFSAPYNPMSNGQAERFVDTFKRTFKKLKGERAVESTIIETFLVTYRTTPNSSLPGAKCPAEIFLGRKPRTALDLLRPPTKPSEIRDDRMEMSFNRRHGAKPRSFHLNDKVFARYRKSQPWKAGTISRCTGVIYDVKFPDGNVNRYHANQLLERYTSDSEEDDYLEVFNDAFELPIPEKIPEIGIEQPEIEVERAADQEQDIIPPRSPPNVRVSPRHPQRSPPRSPPIRRSQRDKRAPTKLIVDPHQKTYRPN